MVEHLLDSSLDLLDRFDPRVPNIHHTKDDTLVSEPLQDSWIQRGRKAWRQLLDDVHKGRVRLIGFLRLDRAFRNTADAILTCTDLTDRGVDIVALNSPFDTTTPAGRLTLTIFAALAEFELDLIKTRVNEGLDRARAKGVRLGRPPGSKDKKQRKRRNA